MIINQEKFSSGSQLLARRRGSMPRGIEMLGDEPASTPKNAGGVTPTMVNSTPERVIVLPMQFGSPPKRCCQKLALRTATGSRLSFGPMRRPISGETPSTGKYDGEIHCVKTDSDGPFPMRIFMAGVQSAKVPERTWL